MAPWPLWGGAAWSRCRAGLYIPAPHGSRVNLENELRVLVSVTHNGIARKDVLFLLLVLYHIFFPLSEPIKFYMSHSQLFSLDE